MSRLLNPRRSLHRTLCLFLCITSIAGPRGMALAEQPASTVTQVDLQYVLPNAALVAVLRPTQVLKAPLAELLPTEVLQAAMLKELGLDPMAAEQIVVSAAPPVQGPPSYAAVTRFSEKFTLKASEITQHTQKAKLQGKDYLQSTQTMLPSFYAPDGTTLVVAPEFSLQGFVDPKLPPSPLGGRLAEASRGDDLLAMFDFVAIRPLVTAGLNVAFSKPDVPPQLAPLRDAPELVKSIELRINLSRDDVSELIIAANDAEDAEKLLGLVEKVKEFAAQQTAGETARLLASDDPIEQALGRYQQRMTKVSNERFTFEREGERIVVFRSDGSASTNPLVAIAVVGMLVALLLPAVQAAREAARRNAALNDAKQIMLALFDYESANGHFPSYASFDESGKPLLSWRVHILPYMEQQALYERFHLDEPWNSPHNKALIPLMPEEFNDPSSRFSPKDGKSSYLGVLGEDYFFAGDKKERTFARISDGTTRTVSFVQVDDAHAAVWTKPQDWSPDDDDPLTGLGGLHAGGFLAGFCDGHARILPNDVDRDLFRALLTTSGREMVEAP